MNIKGYDDWLVSGADPPDRRTESEVASDTIDDELNRWELTIYKNLIDLGLIEKPTTVDEADEAIEMVKTFSGDITQHHTVAKK